MLNLENIHSLTDFRRNASAYVERIKGKDTALVLTVNGEAAAVVLDSSVFQAMLDRVRQLEEELTRVKLEALRENISKAVEQADRGELLDGEDVMARLIARHQAALAKEG